MRHLTESEYKIIADRMIEEHRKYGDRLRPGHWADVAARKVASHMADFREGDRVFTESEVKAMLVNITHECGCYEHRGEPVFATRVDDINHIAARHGVVLDPA